MNTFPTSLSRFSGLRAAVLALAGLLVIPTPSGAKGPKGPKSNPGHRSHAAASVKHSRAAFSGGRGSVKINRSRSNFNIRSRSNYANNPRLSGRYQSARHFSYSGRNYHSGRSYSYYPGRSYSYRSHPRTTFRLSFGNGYRGRGYYYGPPGLSYYYESPGVYFMPRTYSYNGYASSYSSNGAAVQRELYRLGYYGGPIDGVIGSGSREAIVRYQADQGLAVTGVVDSALLQSLGIW